jgi:CBS domain containing-hemolysin-like protein
MHPAPLPTFKIEPSTLIAQAEPPASAPVTLDSPALAVVTDLTQVKAATTAPGASLSQAEQTMIYQGVRMLFVVTGLPSFAGLVTTTDLHGDRAQRIVAERGLRHDELTVADVMTPLESLDAVEYERLAGATVGHLIATLKRFGRNHLLVVERPTAQTPRRVRGVISRAQIERQLGQPIVLSEIASSFAEIERALA